MLKLANEGGRGVRKMLTLADIGVEGEGGVLTPPIQEPKQNP